MDRIFLDVGAHLGETVREALKPVYQIDVIHAFEPSPHCHAALAKLAQDPRVELHEYGLWNQTGEALLHNSGTVAGTLCADYQSPWVGKGPDVRAWFVKASDWFAEHLGTDTEIILKLNCEGAEGDILFDLIQSKQYFKVYATLVHWDVRKSPEKRQQEADLKVILETLGITNVFDLGTLKKGKLKPGLF